MEQIEATLDDAGYTFAKEPQSAPRTSGKPLSLQIPVQMLRRARLRAETACRITVKCLIDNGGES